MEDKCSNKEWFEHMPRTNEDATIKIILEMKKGAKASWYKSGYRKLETI